MNPSPAIAIDAAVDVSSRRCSLSLPKLGGGTAERRCCSIEYDLGPDLDGGEIAQSNAPRPSDLAFCNESGTETNVFVGFDYDVQATAAGLLYCAALLLGLATSAELHKFPINRWFAYVR